MHACAGFLLLAMLPLGAAGDELVELTGRFEIRATNCFSEDAGDHSHTELLLLDETTYEHTRLTGDKKVLSRLKPDQLVRIRGYRVDPAGANGGSSPGLKATTLEGAMESDLAVETFEVLEEAEDGFGDIRAFGSGSETASGANDRHMLTCLLVFASSTDFPSATVESNALGLLFDNPTNANEAMQAVTKGRYGLQLGNGSAENPIVHLQLDVSSSGKDSDDMETLMLAALSDAGYNRFDYNRVLLFPPDGIKSFTAFGYFGSSDTPGSGRRTVYGKSYGNTRMNGFIHEFGHNFGFHHSRKGSNEYGDRTCVMGLSRDETKTETYSGVKLLETNWLDVFPGAKLEVTQDVTLDLYPLSSDPNLLSEVITVAISGTPYVVGYHIDDRPYGFLSQSGDRERLFVYRREEEPVSEFRPFSYQEANLGPGEEFSGPGVITFDRHGPDNEYATVSIDIDDGNAKPEATAQSLFTNKDAPLMLTLQGADADADPLTYAIVEGPSSGSLSGTAPNLTYTPNGGFEGDDAFIFSVNDGLISSFAAVDIRVETNNFEPEVDAGVDQTAVISGDAPWTPAQLATTAWYDASDAGTITENAGAVSQWTDKSGNGLHLTQASGVAQPISGTASINGDNAIQFDGSDDTLATSNNPFAPTIQDALVVAVHKVGATGSGQTLFTLNGSGAKNGRWQAHAPWGSTVYFDTGGSGGNNRVATSYAASGGDNVLVGFYGSTTEGLQQIFKNGALLAGDSSGHSVGTAGNIHIGSDGNSQFQDTSIGEVVIIEGTVSVEDRQKLEGYLAHRWGLAASLPTGHPYAEIPPGGAGASVDLDGTVTDEDGGTPATSWSQVSGPGTVTFSDPSAADTTATITEAGVYVLRLTAEDGIFETFDEVTITIPDNLEQVDVVATDNAYAREDAPVEDASSELLIKKDTWSSTARWAYLRFPLSGDAAIGGVDAAGIAQVSLFVNATRHISGDTFVVYALRDGANDPTTALSETSWTGGTDGTEAGGNNLQGSSRPDGENNLPNAFSTTALGSFTFASSGDDTDLGIKEIAISDLPTFKQLVEDDQNGEITLIITGTVGGSGSGITSLFAGTPALAPRLVIERELAPNAPLAPADLIATGGNASVSLSWTDNSDNETGFIVQRSDTPGGPYIEISTTGADLASYVDSGLDAGSTFYYEVVATNAGGDSAPAPEASATTFTASEAWRDQYFAQIENSGDAADSFDFDGDGLSNLLERAFGTLPNDSNSWVAMPQGNVVEFAGADYLSISYRRRIGGVGVTGDGYTADGLTYRVEYDADLTDPWSSGSVVAVGPTVDNGNGTESVTVRLNTPTSGPDQQFIRLNVTAAP